jgi:hypothetical protein
MAMIEQQLPGNEKATVVDGFIALAGLKLGRIPHLVCPEWGGPFRAVVAGS